MKLDYRIIVLSSIFDLIRRLQGYYINTAAGIDTEIFTKNIPRVQKRILLRTYFQTSTPLN